MVETAIVEVVTEVESAGQLVTVEAQLTIVISLVVYTVEVVNLRGILVAGVVVPVEEETVDESPTDEETVGEVAADEPTDEGLLEEVPLGAATVDDTISVDEASADEALVDEAADETPVYATAVDKEIVDETTAREESEELAEGKGRTEEGRP